MPPSQSPRPASDAHVASRRRGASFPKERRLLRGPQFKTVFDYRCSAADDVLVVYGYPNRLGGNRLGVVVSRKIGNAVVRNSWKRRLREAFRQLESPVQGVDLVVLPRRGNAPEFVQVQQSLRRLVERLGRKIAKRTDAP